MTTKNEIKLMEYRLNKLEGTEKNIKSPGVVRKLRRKIKKAQQRN